MLYLDFLQLFHLVYETGNKKRKRLFFIKSKCEYLRVYLKSMNWDVQESLESYKLRIWEFKYKRNIKELWSCFRTIHSLL